MGSLLHDWFPDAPMWIPWLAFWLMVALFLLFLACLVASPFEAWRNRHSHESGDEIGRRGLGIRLYRRHRHD